MAKYEEKFEKILQIKEGGHLSLKNANGEIKVKSWEENKVKIMATKKGKGFTSGDAREKANQVKIEINEKNNEVYIDTIYPRRRWFGIDIGTSSSAQVSYLLYVPQKINLDLKNLNGMVLVENIVGEVNAKTYNGRGILRNVKGNIALSSLNGGLELIKLVSDKIDAHTLQGGIKADICVVKNGKYHLKTLNGSIDVKIPFDSSTRIFAKTLNGHINYNLSLVKVKSTRRNLEGILKADEASLNLDTLNGSIHIEGYEGAGYIEAVEEKPLREEKVEQVTSENLEEEKAMILKLVKEGKITAEEAKELLKVMGISEEGVNL